MGKKEETTGFRIEWGLRELGPRLAVAAEPIRGPRPAGRVGHRSPGRPAMRNGRRAGAGS